MELTQLGERICIMGPSNSGKSTLAQKLGKKLNVPVCHLDQLAHVTGTNWVPRANIDWVDEHDTFIKQDRWIMEGNYSFSMPQRFARATTLIWLDFGIWGCIIRYIGRSLKNDPNRPGRLADATQDFSFTLIHYMLFTYPQKRLKSKAIIEQSGVPLLRITSVKELNRYYQRWGLKR